MTHFGKFLPLRLIKTEFTETMLHYPTDSHYAALAIHGPTPIHRRSFRLTARPEQTSLF